MNKRKSNKDKKGFMVSVVIPTMNEEENVGLIYERLKPILCTYDEHEIIFIDDGSTDNTLARIKQINKTDKTVRYLSLSRNFGHQNALKAGLDFSRGDCVISMDGDLQHPPELIPEMIAKWQEGYQVVYTIRQVNPETGFFKRLSANLFYKLINRWADVGIEQGSADFRLLDRVIVDIIANLREIHLFFRGLVPWMGFNQYGIVYTSAERQWGKTKYSLRNMIQFALTGITGFSIKPLTFSIKLGFVIAIFAFIYGVYALYIRLFTNTSIEGWASLLIVTALIGGIQLITIGILGEYLGKLFIEQKQRPSYIIKEKSDD